MREILPARMRMSGNGNKTRGHRITFRLRHAILLSLLVHLPLLWLLRLPARHPRPAPVPIQVHLQQARPPSPEPASRTTPEVPAPPPVASPAPPTHDGTRPPSSKTRDWLAEARDVIQDMRTAPRPLNATPPLRRPMDSRPDRHDRFPALRPAFQPLPRPRKLCGALVEFQFGVHEISMPVGYWCEDKQEEYRTAPGAGRHIDDPERGR